ncbi:transcriptional regulator [Aureivirga marina]|uniref:hypothetical protein n=1 Tax=Aureivirga marina TaxID=1182451 RepID=UPI0018CAAEEB|nr:hypothetical protein [Aureivirga marina]
MELEKEQIKFINQLFVCEYIVSEHRLNEDEIKDFEEIYKQLLNSTSLNFYSKKEDLIDFTIKHFNNVKYPLIISNLINEIDFLNKKDISTFHFNFIKKIFEKEKSDIFFNLYKAIENSYSNKELDLDILNFLNKEFSILNNYTTKENYLKFIETYYDIIKKLNIANIDSFIKHLDFENNKTLENFIENKKEYDNIISIFFNNKNLVYNENLIKNYPLEFEFKFLQKIENNYTNKIISSKDNHTIQSNLLIDIFKHDINKNQKIFLFHFIKYLKIDFDNNLKEETIKNIYDLFENNYLLKNSKSNDVIIFSTYKIIDSIFNRLNIIINFSKNILSIRTNLIAKILDIESNLNLFFDVFNTYYDKYIENDTKDIINERNNLFLFININIHNQNSIFSSIEIYKNYIETSLKIARELKYDFNFGNFTTNLNYNSDKIQKLFPNKIDFRDYHEETLLENSKFPYVIESNIIQNLDFLNKDYSVFTEEEMEKFKFSFFSKHLTDAKKMKKNGYSDDLFNIYSYSSNRTKLNNLIRAKNKSLENLKDFISYNTIQENENNFILHRVFFFIYDKNNDSKLINLLKSFKEDEFIIEFTSFYNRLKENKFEPIEFEFNHIKPHIRN